MTDACCAHMRVRFRTVEQGSGCVSGHWECDDCFTEFAPVNHKVSLPQEILSLVKQIENSDYRDAQDLNLPLLEDYRFLAVKDLM